MAVCGEPSGELPAQVHACLTDAALDGFAHAMLAASVVDPERARTGPLAITGELRPMYMTHARTLAKLRHALYPRSIDRLWSAEVRRHSVESLDPVLEGEDGAPRRAGARWPNGQ